MNRNITNILVVEDDPLTLNSIVDLLEAENFQVTEALNGETALEIALEQLPDLIVCDLKLPKLNGYQFLSSLRKNINTADIPFIVLTGKNKRQDVRQGMELGVSDYITKPFLNDELVRAIETQLKKKRFLEKCYQAKLQYTSKIPRQKRDSKSFLYYDQLTNLPNHLSLRDKFDQVVNIYVKERINDLSSSLEKFNSIAVCCISLDRFEEVSDNLDREQSYSIIKTAAQRLTNSLGNQAKIIRLNAGDFVVILPYIEHLNQAIAAIKIAQSHLLKSFTVNEQKISFTPYVGISFYPSQGEEIEILLKRARKAVEQAKQNAEDCYEVYQPGLDHTDDFKSLLLVDDLRQALKNDELAIHYQPQVNLSNGEIVGCEALLRWNHPQRGNITPQTFIPIAEDIGLMDSIGTWFLSTACQQLKIWHQVGFNQIKLAVNLSTYQFNQNNLKPVIIGALDQAYLDPQFLEIELTESILVQDCQNSVEQLSSLKSLGLCLTVDNFGTGYSSLNYLQKFPFDVLKIDLCFLSNFFGEHNSQKMIKSMIKIAHSRNLKVIAEKVETQAQLDFLRQHKCDLAQGYFLSIPLTANQFDKLLLHKSDWISNVFSVPPI